MHQQFMDYKEEGNISLNIVSWILMLWFGFLTNYYRYEKVEILVKSGKIFKTDFSGFFIIQILWEKQFGIEENI